MRINDAMEKIVALYGPGQLISNGADEPFAAADWDGDEEDERSYAVTYQGICEVNDDLTLDSIPAYRFVPSTSADDPGSGLTHC